MKLQANEATSYNFVFFGTDEFAVTVLEELKKAEYTPALIVTAPDKPKGRGLNLTLPLVKVWAQKNGIEFLQPESLKNFRLQISDCKFDLGIVASYGKIIPRELLYLPRHGILNVHPSLLPLYRGPSPIQYQILDGAQETGVTIIRIDEKMDHGPIIAQRKIPTPDPLPSANELEKTLGEVGGKLLVEIFPLHIAQKIYPRPQDDKKATFTKLIKKEDGLINLSDDPELNYRKFLAFDSWPGIYFSDEKKKRVKITDVELKRSDLEEERLVPSKVEGSDPPPPESYGRASGKRSDLKFIIKKVIPEGKKEVDYDTFLRNFST